MSHSERHYPHVQSRRLTREMRRELVTCLRTVTLLAMFSRDSTTVTNIQSCLKSMTIMEPDLILHPVLERAVPSLEALVEVTLDFSFDLYGSFSLSERLRGQWP